MKTPDLDKMCETFIKIQKGEKTFRHAIYDDIRKKISPTISNLLNSGIIDWYHFLIHNKKSGVPTLDDDIYFHLRVSLIDSSKYEKFLDTLPDYCILTKKIKRARVEKITGVDKTILVEEKIEEAWRIIGEQSEWVLNLYNIHKEDITVPPKQIAQFLHFYANMCQLQVQ